MLVLCPSFTTHPFGQLTYLFTYEYRFAGHSLSTQTLILVTIHLTKEMDGPNPVDDAGEVPVKIVVNCDKMVIGSMLLQELKNVFK